MFDTIAMTLSFVYVIQMDNTITTQSLTESVTISPENFQQTATAD